MVNSELNGLAKNRFIDEETQLALASHPYLLCRQHLANNSRITDKAVDVLLAGRANSVKWALVGSNRLDSRPGVIEEVYFGTSSSFKKSWRLGMNFLRGGWYGQAPNTPIAVLKDIYNKVMNSGRSSYWGRHLAEHPNVTKELAVQMSLSECGTTRKAAFDAIVRLRKEELSAANT
tara:strand:- start:1197 stop:1724 length:528 start_codon:yes stop_codon:yes gene_type:complete